MSKPKRLTDALARLQAAEDRFLANEFLAPVLRGGQVQVRVASVLCKLAVEPADYEGWGVFKPTSHSAANLVRPARLAERQRYLELFPLLRLVLSGRQGEQWLGMPAHASDNRFRIEGQVPVRLVDDDVQLFEVIQTRFAGGQFWYEAPDPRRDAATAAFLRQALDQMIEPDKLVRPGLTAEERAAYAASYWPRYEATEEGRRGREENRLRDALAHAGAEFKEYRERADAYTVTFEVDGRRHVSVVAKHDLSLQVAGICLSGEDEAFDLQSLVGVIREAQGSVVRVGVENEGMPEDQYWRVHPPR